MGESLALTLPEIILTIGAIVLMLAAAFAGDRHARTITWLAVATLALAAFWVPGITTGGGIAFDGLFVADSFAAFAKVLIYVGAAAALIAADGWFGRAGDYRAEYPVLVLLSSIGMGMMASAGDLLTLYVGLELQSLAAYVLASFQRTDNRSAEAGLKYFVLGALASGILLYGVSLLYGFTGSTLFGDVAIGLQTDGVSTGELFGIVFVLAGIAFKVSAVPFHMWTPDVYEGAPTPVTAFFASAPKVAAMALLTRVAIEGMGPATFEWRQIVIFMALASTILGGVAAIGQPNIKRLLAYSSINNVGFALIGLAAANPEGVSAILFYMAVYVVMTIGSFLVVLRMRDEAGEPVETIASLSGLSRTRPALAAGMAIFMFSLAGIPPLFGFWPKFLVFDAAVRADLTWLAAVGIATSAISAFYYLKIVKTMYFDDPAPAYGRTSDVPQTVLLVAAALFVSPLGYLAIPFIQPLADNAARALF
ncbi:NADH-quinone oxidoreductase subunit NuoN [Sphingosinicella sp. BN140058]|uniref:NADH-quinone oxidoreductase subunit NuoN n=1 Tax=Sphingosinicella sp. BN140058 TaxID=1892855 RepID=UPI001011107C|nr:NADH-quinone oxidoreductase subunit NuoN [Sphingosinicella sp. BN140058]QAY79014.1 NADH-quinone oxidoreductase subunit NuoN [Sphingosinicella sp. BN140058]